MEKKLAPKRKMADAAKISRRITDFMDIKEQNNDCKNLYFLSWTGLICLKSLDLKLNNDKIFFEIF